MQNLLEPEAGNFNFACVCAVTPPRLGRTGLGLCIGGGGVVTEVSRCDLKSFFKLVKADSEPAVDYDVAWTGS